jgi:hypothetical protein
MIGFAAAVLAAAAAVIIVLVRAQGQDSPVNRPPPEPVPKADGTPTQASTAPATTSAVPYSFTPVSLDAPPPGYQLVYAHFEEIDGDYYCLARYGPVDGSSAGPVLDLIVRPWTQGEWMAGLGAAAERRQWLVGERTVIADGEGPTGESAPDARSVSMQWDDSTNLSLAASTTDGSPLGASFTLDDLVRLAGDVIESPDLFTEGPLVVEAP